MFLKVKMSLKSEVIYLYSESRLENADFFKFCANFAEIRCSRIFFVIGDFCHK